MEYDKDEVRAAEETRNHRVSKILAVSTALAVIAMIVFLALY